jgi:nucleotide-binding universal stress UspA family protein
LSIERRKNVMRPIVCATRGGKACHRTQGYAIDLAKERNAQLIFLFVADPNFAGTVDEALRVALEDELARLGRSILHMAQQRALEQGLTANAVVRHGTVRKSIEEYVRQVDANTLVIGSPDTGQTPQEFTDESLTHFAQAIQEATGAKVLIVE